MAPTKTVIIGAGSASFGLNTLAALMRAPNLHGSQLALVDQNPITLQLVSRLADRLNREWDSEIRITCFESHQPALEGADFIILSIEVPPREALWRLDYEIPLRYGVRQPYAENGGPGGFAHAARNIGPVMQIVRDIEATCPEAWVINFTNPMARICDAIARFSRVKVVGLCHQILVGYALVGIALAHDMGILVPPGITGSHSTPEEIPRRRMVAAQAVQKFDILAVGLNHFTWMLSLRDRKSGKNLYPLFQKRWKALDPNFEPLTRRIYDVFGVFPIPGDEHLCEYLPWVSDNTTRPWEKFDLSLYDWELWSDQRQVGHEQIARLASGEVALSDLYEVASEGAVEVIQDLLGAESHRHLALNLPNRGQIPNLPEGAIVETPGVITPLGIEPVRVPELPEPIAELCRREITVTRLCAEAAVHGDRQKALQCLLLDPVIRDLDVAQAILEDYLLTYREYLPQFWQ